MNKKIRVLLILLAIPIVILTLIQSDFKNFKSSSKRIAEEINFYYSSTIEKELYYDEENINKINGLKKYLIENNKIFASNTDKFNIYISIGDKENFYKKYKIGFYEAIEDRKKLKIGKEKYYLITKNLIRLYEKDSKYLMIVSDNSFILKKLSAKIIKFFVFLLIFSISLIYIVRKTKFTYHKKIYKDFINMQSEVTYLYYFILFFSIFNFIYPKFSSDYWYFFYVSLLIFIIVFHKKIKENINQKFFPIIIIIFSFIMIHNFIYNFGYMGRGTGFEISRKLILLLSILPITIYFLKKLNYKNHSIFIALFIGFGFSQFRSFNENIVDIKDLILLNIFIVINYYLLSLKYSYKILFFIFFIIIIFLGSFLAFRTDYLYLEEQGFHISFYVSPIIAQIESNGYRLLFDQPSQYGFLNILLPSLLNFKNGLNSFHLFQSSMMIFTVIIGFFIVLKSNIKINKIFLFVFFSILFFLSDPTLVGPNPYPSSSILRFFPVYLLIIINEICDIDPLKKYSNLKVILLSFIFSISFLWSIEAFCYVVFPFVVYVLLNVYNNFKNLEFKILFINIFKIFITFSIFIILILYIYKVTNNLSSINLNMHFLSVLAYGEGYMTVSLTPFSPMLIVVIPIFLLINKVSNIKDFKLNFYILLMLGLLSYFFGRAVPNNILALWPIYFLIFGIITSYIDKKLVGICLIPMLLIISVTQLSILKNREVLKIENLKPKIIFNENIIKEYEVTSTDFPDNLNFYMKQIPKNKSITVLSFGKFGKNAIRFDGNPHFIPMPFHLFAIPINPDDSAKILYNSPKFKSLDGYVVFDKKWARHYEGFWNKIKLMKNCKIEYKSKRFEAFFCEKGFTR
tara:strand:- start:994 stop:3558 length:2565 start_codon:yes stop_codon:yes gene_type:complete